MAASSITPEDPYESGTRSKYRDPDIAKAYHAEFARFSFRPHAIFVRAVTRGERRAIRSLLSDIKGARRRVADIPCGTGKLLPVFQSEKLNVIAGDVSLEMLDIARRSSLGRAFSFVCLDAAALPFGNASFDLVICLRLLHRVPYEIKVSVLAELGRVSGQYLVVSLGVSSVWHQFRGMLRRLLTGVITVPHPILGKDAVRLFESTGWTVRRHRSALPVLSAERIFLLQRARSGAVS